MARELLNNRKLLISGVVANNRMNRGRGISGGNSYQKDLSFNAVEFLQKRLVENKFAAWLDLCCGEGRALIETATVFAQHESEDKLSRCLQMIGIDLAGMFRQIPAELKFLRLLETAVEDFEPLQKFDLVTCVHGLHYIGDKISVIQRAASWLKGDGVFLANLDLRNLKFADTQASDHTFTEFLKNQDFTINKRKNLIAVEGGKNIHSPFEYVGADDKAGPNYTGQPGVDSYYRMQ